MNWYDWFGVFGSAVSILGVPFAVYRILRTHEIVRATERHLASQELIRLLPELRSAEVRIDAAIADGERETAISSLLLWRSHANRLQGLLADDVEHAALVAALRTSVSLASDAKNALVKMKPPTPEAVERATRAFRSHAAHVSDDADILETRLSTRMPGGSR